MPDQFTTDIVIAVAEKKGINPISLEYSIAEYIDPDALERLANYDSGEWTLSFELPEYEVTVTSDDEIRVDAAGDGKQQR